MSKNTKLRIISATVYIIILLAFFGMKLLFANLYGRIYGSLWFDALVLLFAIVGTQEMLNAFGEKLHRMQKIVVMTFAVLIILTYAVSDFIFVEILDVEAPVPGEFGKGVGRNYSLYFVLGVFITGVAVLFALLVFRHGIVTLENTGYALISLVYPSLFLLTLSICNHFVRYDALVLVFVFVISPCADTFAFLFGKLFGKKLPAKMAPNISPNKTVIGGVGGLIGGLIGGVVVFLLYFGVCLPVQNMATVENYVWTVVYDWRELLFFCAIGVIVSAFAQFGDLVESAIKRNLDIKDMGKIMPGHGGILDRIDSSLYASLIVALIFVARIMIVG